MSKRISIKEKIGYGLGDAAANIGWRGVGTFLFIFYTDVFGLDPVTVGVLFLEIDAGHNFVLVHVELK